MSLLKCPECGGSVSDSAPACPHCGLPISKFSEKPNENTKPISDIQNQTPSESKNSNDKVEKPISSEEKTRTPESASETVGKSDVLLWIKRSLAILGAICLLAGVFLPFLRAPGENVTSLFGNGSAFGIIIIVWGLVVLGFASANRFKEQMVPGFLSGLLVVLLYWAISSQPNGDSLEYGAAWWVLIIGAILIIISSSLPGKVKNKKNAVLLWILVAILLLISSFVYIATLETIGRATSGSSQSSTQTYLGIGEEGLSGICEIGSVEFSSLPRRKPNGSAWDPLGGAPDPMLIIYIDDVERYTSNALSDRYGSLSWRPNLAVNFSDVSKITLEVIDEDMSNHDRMFIKDLDVDEMRWGTNSYSNSSGFSLEVEIE